MNKKTQFTFFLFFLVQNCGFFIHLEAGGKVLDTAGLGIRRAGKRLAQQVECTTVQCILQVEFLSYSKPRYSGPGYTGYRI